MGQQSHPTRLNPYSPDTQYTAMLMSEVRARKHAGMQINLIKEWFPLTDLDKPTILGSFAWTSKALGQKWILQHHAHFTDAGWVSPADIARDYLEVKYSNRKMRITSDQYRIVTELKRQAPLAAFPQKVDRAVYIDLKSAYWSILRVVGWDVDYNPDKFLMVQSDVEDFPYPHVKLARNSLVSAGLAGEMRMWTGTKLVFKKRYNQFLNNILWTLVQDVLNSIAREILPFAIYINTDGYMVKPQFVNTVMDIIGEWGLPCSVKFDGRAEVYNVGQYNIEGKRYIEPRSKIGKPCVKIHHPNIQWLKKRFAKFAQEREF